MTYADDDTLRKGLREKFPKEQIGLLPRSTKKDNQKGKCGVCGGWHGLPAVHLDYVGHAAVTDRLNAAAPDWTLTIDRVVENNGHVLAVIGTMTIGGKPLPEVGEPSGESTYGMEMQTALGNLIRRAAMRFGVGIDLWSKEELSSSGAPPQEAPEQEAAEEGLSRPDPAVSTEPARSEEAGGPSEVETPASDATTEQMERAAAVYGSAGLVKMAYHDTFGHAMRKPAAAEIEQLILAKAGATA